MTAAQQEARSEQTYSPKIVPPIRFGPAVSNILYWAVLAISLLIGFLSLLSGQPLINVLIHFFVSLIGTAILGGCFLVFVIMPLHVKHYERVVEARREAIRRQHEEARQKAEQEAIALRDERQAMVTRMAEMAGMDPDALLGEEKSAPEKHPEDSTEENPVGQHKQTPRTETEPDLRPATQETAVEDQASSLRKMMAVPE